VKKLLFINSNLLGGRQNTVHFCPLMPTGAGTVELEPEPIAWVLSG
jgi:hypothetical protein